MERTWRGRTSGDSRADVLLTTLSMAGFFAFEEVAYGYWFFVTYLAARSLMHQWTPSTPDQKPSNQNAISSAGKGDKGKGAADLKAPILVWLARAASDAHIPNYKLMAALLAHQRAR
ncbi:hypothetical protein K438DRAFT_1762240 [Mycena galopus ATCC 62051]|nr:hypothetical protein K438DRAFT_1762240 [Mycena galopus ATCC 62051]